MSNKQQTAIDYLIGELIIHQIIKEVGEFTGPLIEQAKELQKQQIENAYENGAYDIIYSRGTYEDGEQYYNETYEATDK